LDETPALDPMLCVLQEPRPRLHFLSYEIADVNVRL
jgi:hypothetical protein